MGRRVVFFVLVAIFTLSTYCAADVIKLKLANYFPPTHMNSVMMGKYCEELNKKLAGKVEITQYTGYSLRKRWQQAFRQVLPIWGCRTCPIQEGVFLLWKSWSYLLVFRARGLQAMWLLIFTISLNQKILIITRYSCSARPQSMLFRL